MCSGPACHDKPSQAKPAKLTSQQDYETQKTKCILLRVMSAAYLAVQNLQKAPQLSSCFVAYLIMCCILSRLHECSAGIPQCCLRKPKSVWAHISCRLGLSFLGTSSFSISTDGSLLLDSKTVELETTSGTSGFQPNAFSIPPSHILGCLKRVPTLVLMAGGVGKIASKQVRRLVLSADAWQVSTTHCLACVSCSVCVSAALDTCKMKLLTCWAT